MLLNKGEERTHRKGLSLSIHLPMEGGFNFRDLGGMENNEGWKIKSGMIIRSDDLMNLTEKDLDYLSSLSLKTIIDFRSESEVNAAPDKLPRSVKNYYSLTIDPGNIMELLANGTDMNFKAEEGMQMLYKSLVIDTLCVNKFREFFALLQDADKAPFLYHCSAGKDRTGVATALLLSALNFSREVIIQDYLHSNIYLKNKYKKYIDIFPLLQAFFEVKPEYLEIAFHEIVTMYGSVDNYLISKLSVNVEKLREIYLQK